MAIHRVMSVGILRFGITIMTSPRLLATSIQAIDTGSDPGFALHARQFSSSGSVWVGRSTIHTPPTCVNKTYVYSGSYWARKCQWSKN